MLCKALPFDVIGSSSLGNAACGVYGQEHLSLTVLTSDTVKFAAASTNLMTEDNIDSKIKDAYNTALAKLEGTEPVMILTFAPFSEGISASRMLEALNAAANGLPIFGTLASSNRLDLTDAKSLYNGEESRNELQLVVIAGDVKPKFRIASLKDANIQQRKGTVTDADDFWIKEVDNMPLLDYLEISGLAKSVVVEATTAFPIIIDFADGGTPIARTLYSIDIERGYGHFGESIPIGAKLAIGKQDYDGIMNTASGVVSEILSEDNPQVLIMFPCLSRSLLLGASADEEMALIVKLLGDKLNYHLAYSGGEYCPVYISDGKIRNSFHNFSLPVCIL
jgi:hypothetical protein